MKYKIKYNNKSYFVKAKDAQSAIDGLSILVPELKDDRLSPMTYKKLKELGYTHEKWIDLSQEQANKIVARANESEAKPKNESKQKTSKTTAKLSKEDVSKNVNSILKNYNNKNTELKTVFERPDGSYMVSIRLSRNNFPYEVFDDEIKQRSNNIVKDLKKSLNGNFNISEKKLYKGSLVHGVPNELSITLVPKDESTNKSESSPPSGGNGGGDDGSNNGGDGFTETVKSYNDSLLSKYNVKESDLKKPKKPLAIKGGDVLWGLIRSGADISIDDITNHPLIIDANKKLKQKKGTIKKVTLDGKEVDVGENETILIDTPERKKLRQQIADKISNQGSVVKTTDENGKTHTSYSGPVAKNHRAEIVIGVPAGGKSSVIVDKVSQNTQSRVLDSDDVKKELPEFDNGNGAELVHKESADDILTKRIIPQFMKGGKHNGENIIIPIVGKNPNAARKYLKALKDAGYEVHLSFNDVTPTNSAKRATTRFLETGRFLSPEYIDSIGTKPQNTYEELKNGVDGIQFDSFSRYNNNVRFGEPPEKIEHLDKNKKNIKWEEWR